MDTEPAGAPNGGTLAGGSMGGGTGERVPVIVNVYDLSPQNKYTYGCGLGIFHSGVEVYGVEYAFGGEPGPRPLPEHPPRETILARHYREAVDSAGQKSPMAAHDSVLLL